jgi:hypothetical protein
MKKPIKLSARNYSRLIPDVVLDYSPRDNYFNNGLVKGNESIKLTDDSKKYDEMEHHAQRRMIKDALRKAGNRNLTRIIGITQDIRCNPEENKMILVLRGIPIYR